MDRENVINGLEHCMNRENTNCPSCPYCHGGCVGDLCADAFELLKEQKAKPVITTTKDFMGIPVAIRHSCPSCGKGLYGASGDINYCSFCGQKLLWEDYNNGRITM